jgi:hypothetical protein
MGDNINAMSNVLGDPTGQVPTSELGIVLLVSNTALMLYLLTIHLHFLNIPCAFRTETTQHENAHKLSKTTAIWCSITEPPCLLDV